MNNDTLTTSYVATSTKAATLTLKELLELKRKFDEEFPPPRDLTPTEARHLLRAVGVQGEIKEVTAIYLHTPAGPVRIYPGNVAVFEDAMLDLQRSLVIDPDSEHTPTDLPVLLHDK